MKRRIDGDRLATTSARFHVLWVAALMTFAWGFGRESWAWWFGVGVVLFVSANAFGGRYWHGALALLGLRAETTAPKTASSLRAVARTEEQLQMLLGAANTGYSLTFVLLLRSDSPGAALPVVMLWCVTLGIAGMWYRAVRILYPEVEHSVTRAADVSGMPLAREAEPGAAPDPAT